MRKWNEVEEVWALLIDGGAFPGHVGTTLVDSQAAWPVAPRAPEGAPNVLLIITDDAGYGVPSTFGGVIPTPALTSPASAWS